MTPAIGMTSVLLVLAIGFAALGVVAHLRARRLRRLRVAEHIRGTFAEARNALVLKALRGGINPRSHTYRTLYFLQTQMMRREDQYDQMWSTLVAATVTARKEPHANGLATEARHWDADTRKIAAITANGIRAILIEYSLILRIVERVVAHFPSPRPGRQVKPVVEIYRHVESFEERRRPERKQVIQLLPLLDSAERPCAA